MSIDNKKVGELVESISTTIAMKAASERMTGDEIMYALSMVCLTAQHLHAGDVKNAVAAEIFDGIAMELAE